MHFKLQFLFATKLKSSFKTSPSLLKVWDTFIRELLVTN